MTIGHLEEQVIIVGVNRKALLNQWIGVLAQLVRNHTCAHRYFFSFLILAECSMVPCAFMFVHYHLSIHVNKFYPLYLTIFILIYFCKERLDFLWSHSTHQTEILHDVPELVLIDFVIAVLVVVLETTAHVHTIFRLKFVHEFLFLGNNVRLCWLYHL